MNIVYRAFSKNNDLLYIGVTQNLKSRVSTHKSSKEWWGEVDRIDEESFDDRISAMKAEVVAIKLENPKYNKRILQDESKIGAGTSEFISIRIEPDLREKIEQIAKAEHRSISAQARMMLIKAVEERNNERKV